MNILWNAHVIVGDAKVGTGWAVTDDVEKNRTKYHADITVTVPTGAKVSVEEKVPNETVVLKHSASLTCGPNTIEANVTYLVTGGTGSEVQVNVAKVSGHKPPAAGGTLGQATGQVGRDITVHVVIPGSCG